MPSQTPQQTSAGSLSISIPEGIQRTCPFTEVKGHVLTVGPSKGPGNPPVYFESSIFFVLEKAAAPLVGTASRR